MKKQSLIHLTLTLALGVAFCLAVSAQEKPETYKTQEEANKNARQGITFKIPDGYMPMKEWSGFKGLLMLNAKEPAGIFISYPNDGEKIEDLKARVVKYVPPMFVHEDKAADGLKWNITDIPIHEGDKTGSGKMHIGSNEKDAVQISFYEREWKGLTVIYGYFSLRGKKRDKDVWADEKGQGIKAFEKFWKTFPDASQ